ncbi:hypothetical protein Dimus_007752 [Dionaea muscipula]
MSIIHLKKKDVVKTSVKGVAIEFDHLKLASILGIPDNNGICEYIKDVWEESKYTKPLVITRRFANDETLTVARRVKSAPGFVPDMPAQQEIPFTTDVPSQPTQIEEEVVEETAEKESEKEEEMETDKDAQADEHEE